MVKQLIGMLGFESLAFTKLSQVSLTLFITNQDCTPGAESKKGPDKDHAGLAEEALERQERIPGERELKKIPQRFSLK